MCGIIRRLNNISYRKISPIKKAQSGKTGNHRLGVDGKGSIKNSVSKTTVKRNRLKVNIPKSHLMHGNLVKEKILNFSVDGEDIHKISMKKEKVGGCSASSYPLLIDPSECIDQAFKHQEDKY